MKSKVLITTSGIGSRLGELTDFINKSLIRIGDKPAISHIIENYPDDTEFVITLGHFGSHVKEFLEIAYPQLKFEFVMVDKYKGQGTSLAYSILQAKDNLQCPFIFNACDTILYNKEVITWAESGKNFCMGSPTDDSTQYATILIDNNRVIKIKDKGEINYDAAYIGICGIRDYQVFWKELEAAYTLDSNNSSLSDCTVINRMINQVDFDYIETKFWLDMGNVGELEKTRNHFTASAEVLEKKEESIYFFDDCVIKFFSNQNINKNRIIRGKYLEGIVPKIIAEGNNFYKYKKEHGDLFAKTANEDSFASLLKWAKEKLWIPKESDDIKKLCYTFYIEKTKARIQSHPAANQDCEQSINGKLIPTAIELLSQIDTDWLCDGIPTQFHGDFILDNILKTESAFCLLDWRQDFGGSLDVGDIYYDLAKLNHNLIINHEIVNTGLFNHTPSDCYILCKSSLINCKKVLKKFVIENGMDFKKVEVLTSIVWINMAPLHDYPFNRFLFNFGKYNLMRSLND